MTALSTLLDALRTGDTLAWALRYVGSEGPDAAVRAAWDGETDAEALYALAYVGHAWTPTTVPPGLHATPVGCVCFRRYPRVCPACCDAIRAACSCPTWAELTATKGDDHG